MRSSQQEEYRFLPVSCPKCGLDGKLDIRRLDRTFICKRCRRSFHVDPGGIVLGERPNDAPADDFMSARPKPSSRLVAWLERLPRVAWWGIGGFLLIAGVLGTVALVLQAQRAELPESLDGRARWFGEAFARAESADLARVSASGSVRQFEEWMRELRPVSWTGAVDAATPVTVELEVLFKRSAGSDEKALSDNDNSMAQAGILATITPANAKESATLLLYWVQDSSLEWHLDGNRTLNDKAASP